MEIKVHHSLKKKRFEFLWNGTESFLSYGIKQGTLVLMHTTIDPKVKGQGVATKLARTALEHVDQTNQKVAVLCPFVSRFVKRNPEWYRVYDPEYHQNLRQTIKNAIEDFNGQE